jgi:nitrogenase molybdenum-iron protein beta chain
MVKEAREQRFPVLGIAAPGFKGNAWAGYASAARALLEQLPSLLPPSDAAPSPDVNLLGIVPGNDPCWEGDLLEMEAILAAAGLRVNRLVGLGQDVASWRDAPRARVNVVLSPWGDPAARALTERYGTPLVDLGFLPVGSADAGLLLERVRTALSLDAAAIAAARARLDGRLRHFLRKAIPSLLLGDVQERVSVVAGSAAAVGVARFLAGTLGQIVEQVLVTDRPPPERRATLAAAVREVAGEGADVRFLESRHEIARALRDASPEVVLGSALERDAAREVGAALVEVAAPLRATPALRRGLAGVDGAVTLVETLLGAIRRAREEADRDQAAARAAAPATSEPACAGPSCRPPIHLTQR